MITGTFLDEITHGLASANWGPDEWRRDFASMKADGIDTVVLSCAGYRDRAAFDSQVLRKLHPRLVGQDDLVALFLGLAQEHGMSFWFGTYDSGELWGTGQQQKECDVNRALVDEVWERYGRSSAFRGWYFGHELEASDDKGLRAHAELARHVRETSGLPILACPRLCPPRAQDVPDRHREDWERILASVQGLVDVVLFQDGPGTAAAAQDRLAANAQLARQHGVACWSNVETYDRELRERMPIAWPRLRHRMEAALAARVDKLITFEYSHFLSPHSMYGSAHALHRRYREWLATQR